MDYFGVCINPIVSAIVDKLKAGGVLSLDDQRIVARYLLSTIAMNIHRVFDEGFSKDVRVEYAEHILNANKVNKKSQVL